jgi:hypothetical protein
MNANILKLLVVDKMHEHTQEAEPTRATEQAQMPAQVPVQDQETKPARSVSAVIPKLLEVIPETETALIKTIKKFESGLWNQALELRMSGDYWIPLGRILETHVQSFDEPWQQQLLNIYNDTA